MMGSLSLEAKRRLWGSTPNLLDTKEEGGKVPLSFNQEQELSVGYLPPDHPVHLVSRATMIHGPLDANLLEKCIQEIVDAHDSLRTTFIGVQGTKPVQYIHPKLDIKLNKVSLSNNQLTDEQTVLQSMSEEAERPLDISSGPLLRATIYKLKNNLAALLLTAHRAICDEASIKVLLQALFALFEAHIHEQPVSMPLPGMQYSEFATWQRKQFSPEKMKSKLQEWRSYINGAAMVVQLPTDFPLPASPSYKGTRFHIAFPPEVTEQIREVSQQHDVSVEVFLLSAFETLLHRYTGQSNFAIATIGSSQLLPGLKRLIGCFCNTVVVHADMNGYLTFAELLRKVQASMAQALEFSDLPLEKSLKEASPNHPEPTPNVLFNYDGYEEHMMPMNGLKFSQLNLDIKASKYELQLNLMNGNDTIIGFFEYNPDLFVADTIHRLVGHFETLVNGILKAPNEHLSKIPLLMREELMQFTQWNNNFANYDMYQTVHQMIEEQVQKTPNEIAVIYNQQHMTYEQLNNKANQLAHYLQENGVGPETLVAVSVDRGFDMVVAVVGVLKSGGAFFFTDPNYPKERISYMMNDTKARILLTQTTVKGSLPPLKNVNSVFMDQGDPFASKSKSNPTSSVKTSNMAYIQYTSGSTGNPKGVVVEHSHFITNLLAGGDFYKSEHLPNQLAATTLSYVPGILEIFFPLVFGQRMVISKNAFELPTIPQAKEVNYVGAVPSIMVELLRMNALPPAVHTVAMFGETVNKQLVQQIFEQTRVQQILIHFGCTEAGTCGIAPVEKDYMRNPPIGRALPNSQFHVLDSELQPVPIGIPGELYIVSAGLSREYLNRPDLTADRFLPNPYKDGMFTPEHPAPTPDLAWIGGTRDWLSRMYKTGDLVRYRTDGTFDILGRIDHQVKIRGIRVELGEIEAAIQKHPEVQEVVVTAFQPPAGDKKLVAYLVCNKANQITSADLRSFLQTVLPQHMLPSVFMILDKMPLTANGKVDRKLLPQPEITQSAPATNTSVAARNEVEKKMCDIWNNVLQLNSITVDDNFYEVGGNSLRAIQLMLKVSESFDVNLPAKCLFEHPTVEGLCTVVEAALQGQAVLSEAFDPEDEAVLDEDIYPARAYVDVETVWNPRDVFLTGATGFLGAFILAELLQQTKAHVHCMVRSKTTKEGLKRLQENLEKYGLWNTSISHRIHAVLGDLEKPMLGLTRTQFFQMGQRIDVIYHCGAPVNFVKPYSSLKPGSVLGTQEMLRLACLFKVKPVHYVSSVVVLASVEKKIIHEMDDLNSPNSFFHMGYARAKWVAEALLWIAKSRGLPITVLRPGYVVGHSRTGATNTNDYFSRLIKGCIEVGSYPDMNDMMWLIPVDYVSRAIVHVTRMTQSLGKAFHLAPLPGTDVTTVQMLELVREFGYPIRPVTSSQWISELEEDVRHNDNALLPLLPYISHKYRDDYKEQSKRTADYDSTNTLTGLVGSVITCPQVDLTLINTLINYYISIGFINPPPK